MRRLLLAVSIWLLLAPGGAAADALIVGLEQSLIFQSNLFKTPILEVSDGNYEIRPTFRLLRPAGKLAYDVQYEPALDLYFQTPRINGVDHFLRGNIDYAPIPLGKASLSADFANYRSIRSTGAVGPGGIPDVILGAPGRVTRAFGDLSYEQQVRPTAKASGRLRLQSYTYTTPGNVDSLGFDGDVDLLHDLRPNLAIGGSLFASTRGFERRSAQPASRNLVLNPNLVLEAEPIRSVFLELRGGPAWISIRQESTRPIDARFLDVWQQLGPIGALLDSGLRSEGRDSDELTGFFGVSVTKEDAWGYARLAFVRNEEASAGIGSTTIRDSVTGTVQLTPGAWTLRLRANWNERKALSPYKPALDGFFSSGPGGLAAIALRSPAQITQLWVDFTAGRPVWGDRLTAELGVRYLYQERYSLAGEGLRRFDNVVVGVMLRYEFQALPYYVD